MVNGLGLDAIAELGGITQSLANALTRAEDKKELLQKRMAEALTGNNITEFKQALKDWNTEFGRQSNNPINISGESKNNPLVIKDVNLSGIDFDQLNLTNVRFENSKFDNSSFNKSALTNVEFTNGSSFTKFKITNGVIDNVTMDGTHQGISIHDNIVKNLTIKGILKADPESNIISDNRSLSSLKVEATPEKPDKNTNDLEWGNHLRIKRNVYTSDVSVSYNSTDNNAVTSNRLNTEGVKSWTADELTAQTTYPKQEFENRKEKLGNRGNYDQNCGKDIEKVKGRASRMY